MSDRSPHVRRTNRPGLEALEVRELLSTLSALSRPPAEVSILAKRPTHGETIKGSLNGQATQTSGGDLQGQEALTATGQGSPLGGLSFSGQFDFQTNTSGVHVVSYTNGQGILSAPGGQIFVTFSGSGKHTGPSRFSLSLRGSANGGAGQFAMASGSMSGQGSINDRADTFSLSFTLKLSST